MKKLLPVQMKSAEFSEFILHVCVSVKSERPVILSTLSKISRMQAQIKRSETSKNVRTK